MTPPTILPLDSPLATLSTTGGKAQNLARLARAGLPVPPGFIVTTGAYQGFVAGNDLHGFILSTLAATDTNDPTALESASATIRARFGDLSVPSDLANPVIAAYHALPHSSLSTHHASLSAVAVRSSATAEDLADMSFAGQQDTPLRGE